MKESRRGEFDRIRCLALLIESLYTFSIEALSNAAFFHIGGVFLATVALFKTACAIARVRHVHPPSLSRAACWPTLGHAHAYCTGLHSPETNGRGYASSNEYSVSTRLGFSRFSLIRGIFVDL